MKEKNKPVGTVECPSKGCDLVVPVFRFRPRPGAEGRRTVFTGKAYCECPTHGRIGADGNVAINTYIEGHAKWSASAADSSKNPAPAKTPAHDPGRSSAGNAGAVTRAASTAAPARESEPATPTRSGWRTLLD